MRSTNVLGGPLAPCSLSPRTGWFRDGCCRHDARDAGQHTVCIVATAGFLAFSASRGNDLSTPMPEHGFSGLKEGDRWCLCASRWLEAYQAGQAPPVVLANTAVEALGVVSLDALLEHATDLGQA